MKKFLHIIAMLIFPVISLAQYKELPNPPANLQTLPAGSYIIAMDNTNQLNAAGDFNLKSYGLVVYLVNHNIKVKWVIRAGKLKDEADFTVNASKIKPVSGAAADLNFKAGPLVVFAADTTGVAMRIDSFYYNPSGVPPVNSLTGNDRPSVYRTTAPVTVDLRYDMSGFKPKAAILTDGGNENIHEGFMNDAGIPRESWAFSLGTDLLSHCFTFASEPHNDKVDKPEFTTAIQGIRAFVQYGGNFLAQCAAVENYENHPLYGFFQTSTGVTHHNLHYGNDRFTNNDLSYSQYDGDFHSTQTGHMQSWDINTAWANYGYSIQNDPKTAGGIDNIAASVSKLKDPNVRGGVVFYLGNHDFPNLTHLDDINGIRMYMNAFLTPVTINPDCRAGAPLAVTWYSFTATRSGLNVQLEWKTATEKNVKWFYAERSTDGIHFSTFATVAGTGNSNEIQVYTVKDIEPGKGVFFYRIRQEDMDGALNYSLTRSVNLKGLADIAVTIYPNPCNGMFTVATTKGNNTGSSMMIYDNLGRKVYMQALQMNGIPALVDLRRLQTGTYTVVFLSGDALEKVTEKIVIIK